MIWPGFVVSIGNLSFDRWVCIGLAVWLVSIWQVLFINHGFIG